MTPIRRYAGAACAALLVLALGARNASAQYFGQNHVQYETFDFQVLRTTHFDIYFYEQEREAAIQAGRMAERWYARLTEILQDSLRGRQPLILYASPSHFRQTNTVSGLGEGTGGVTESFKRRIVLPFGVSLDESDHVIGHELVHAFQYDIAGRSAGGMGATATLPLWFIEGMAEYFSVGPVDAHTAMWMRDAVQRDALPHIRQLDDPRYFPYRYGQAFWAFVAGRYGDEVVGNMLRVAMRVRDPGLAILNVLKVEPDSLSAEWHAAIRAAYAAPPGDTAPRLLAAQADQGATSALFTRQTTGGRLNVGPSLSPDGSRIVFLSERNRFAIDLYLADAETGRIIKTVTKTAVDPHLESLQFIYSAGAWHPDGRRFAVAATVQGRPALKIYDLTGGGEREVELRDLDEIFNPSWSPDGNQVVFTAQVGGLTDLYIYDFGSSELRRLTNDPYANLGPAWSPDGRRIAFATDRFGTDLAQLSYGPYRIALIDVASGQLTALPAMSGGKQINPQWSEDGRSLFLLADPDGITNVYRFDFADSQYYRLTDLFTGVSGIAAISPALSVGGSRMAFSVYRDGGAEIHRMDAPIAGGEPATQAAGYARASMLPPRDRVPSTVSEYLADARTGLPEADEFRVERYRPSFGLDYIAQTNVGVSTSRFGTFASGGAALYWSSMLGERQLVTMLQVNGTLKDIAAGVGYANLNNRIDWSVQVSQIPYSIQGYQTGQDSSGNFVQRQIVQRQTNRQAALALQYPFNRAQRFEVQVGGRHISFDGEYREDVFDINTGAYLGRREGDFFVGDALMLGEGLAALVFDNSIFGGTGPIMGARWRLEASPTFGDLNYVGALVDARKYFSLSRSLSLGTRVTHYGRYGPGGDDPRLQPMFIGYQSMVRGYDNGSFSARECNASATPTDDCPVYNQLLGSRVLVGNLEFRLQLLGPFGLTAPGFLPIDLIAFGDAGVAWDGNTEPKFMGGTRSGVSSVGGGVRINVFGFMIGEMVMVRPLDRPEKGWYFQLGFNPGF